MGLAQGLLTGCCKYPAKETVVLPGGHEVAAVGTEKSQVTFEARAVSMSESQEALMDYSFDPFRFERPALCAFFVQMLQCLGLQEALSIAKPTVAGFAEEVSLTYRDVSYHSFFHAIGVTQFLFALYSSAQGPCEILTQEDVLAMFVASLVHDADHPGNNNAWEVATKSPLAVKYSDEAVLERHHAAVGMRIMSRDRHNMFGVLDERAQDEARKTYVHAILMTDMAQHGQMVVDMKDRAGRGSEAFRSGDSDDRRALVGVLMHSADISNPLLPNFNLCRCWAEKIKDEFWSQYTNELERNLPPTQMFASLDTALGFYKSQVGFIDFVVSPLWSSVFDIFPALTCEGGLRDSLSQNRARWEQEVKRETEEAAAVDKRGSGGGGSTAAATSVKRV